MIIYSNYILQNYNKNTIEKYSYIFLTCMNALLNMIYNNKFKHDTNIIRNNDQKKKKLKKH